MAALAALASAAGTPGATESWVARGSDIAVRLVLIDDPMQQQQRQRRRHLGFIRADDGEDGHKRW